jgi:hypothetical protein
MKLRVWCALVVLSPPLLSLTGCSSSIPKDALIWSPTTLQERQLQTRRFDGGDEAKMLSAVAGVLQDLGFNLDESETKLGLVVGSKKRSAVSTGQQIGAFFAALGGAYVATDKEQVVRASVVVRPLSKDTPEKQIVRVTFQRVIWNTQGQVTKREAIIDEQIYKEFFDKMSKAVFLEAHAI